MKDAHRSELKAAECPDDRNDDTASPGHRQQLLSVCCVCQAHSSASSKSTHSNQQPHLTDEKTWAYGQSQDTVRCLRRVKKNED